MRATLNFILLLAPLLAGAVELTQPITFVHGGCYQFGSSDFNGDGMKKKER